MPLSGGDKEAQASDAGDLKTDEERETWLRADWPDASKLQRPLPDSALQIAAQGGRRDAYIGSQG